MNQNNQRVKFGRKRFQRSFQSRVQRQQQSYQHFTKIQEIHIDKDADLRLKHTLSQEQENSYYNRLEPLSLKQKYHSAMYDYPQQKNQEEEEEELQNDFPNENASKKNNYENNSLNYISSKSDLIQLASIGEISAGEHKKSTQNRKISMDSGSYVSLDESIEREEEEQEERLKAIPNEQECSLECGGYNQQQELEKGLPKNEQERKDQEKYNFQFKHSYSDQYQIKQVGGVVVNQIKFFRLNDEKYKTKKNKNFKYLLPKKQRNVLKTIVLDMDETLIYSYPEEYTTAYNFYYITVIRPHLLEFLRELRSHYELVLFTAAEEDYTRRILLGFNIIDEFDHLLFRQHMTKTDQEYYDDETDETRAIMTKDLTFLGRPLKHVCIIDDKKQRFERQPNNGIEIPRWIGKDKEDKSLLILKKFFLYIAQNRQIYQNFNFSKGIFHEFKLNYTYIEACVEEIEKKKLKQQIAQKVE